MGWWDLLAPVSLQTVAGHAGVGVGADLPPTATEGW